MIRATGKEKFEVPSNWQMKGYDVPGLCKYPLPVLDMGGMFLSFT